MKILIILVFLFGCSSSELSKDIYIGASKAQTEEILRKNFIKIEKLYATYDDGQFDYSLVKEVEELFGSKQPKIQLEYWGYKRIILNITYYEGKVIKITCIHFKTRSEDVWLYIDSFSFTNYEDILDKVKKNGLPLNKYLKTK